MNPDIKEKVREIISRVRLWYGGTGKERDDGLDDDGAVEAILSLTTKAELAEAALTDFLNTYPLLVEMGNTRTLAEEICSHFSKPIKYPEKKKIYHKDNLCREDCDLCTDICWDYKNIQENKKYNNLINDMKALNKEE